LAGCGVLPYLGLLGWGHADLGEGGVVGGMDFAVAKMDRRRIEFLPKIVFVIRRIETLANQMPKAQVQKSFLVLFFKKELLALLKQRRIQTLCAVAGGSGRGR
jgi:hypothetical protein